MNTLYFVLCIKLEMESFKLISCIKSNEITHNFRDTFKLIHILISCSRSAKPQRPLHVFFFIIYPCLPFIGMTHLRSIPPRACVMISSILRSVYCSTPSMLSGEMSNFFSSSIICPPQHAASASVYNKSPID